MLRAVGRGLPRGGGADPTRGTRETYGMTNQDEWFYREPSDSQGPGTAWSRGSNGWGNQEPNGLRPHQSLAGTQYRGNQAPADWGRENSGTGQSVGDPWAEPDSRRPPP